eukprot:CAMPEP_0197637796 /NCGR_PEP_ID=MMETSP1338-20131121/12911_1 /TAXON_ID=43686 ORGANISM="Pelagodinium beii, Strain RCC1491" /NCGR_SAMPLE_ID=MMETSP1338 /ASSEMBLY_ACC=CAM_ASM_000754 /LENGTH=553 /DNA_ID=CAMNT_0043210267 /DNA_START=50 /DNA_END=1711 /DNA_ORIENTATION=-
MVGLIYSLIWSSCLLFSLGDDDFKREFLQMQAQLAILQQRVDSLEVENRRLQEEESEDRTPGIIPSDSTRPYTDIEDLQIAQDHAWIILCGALVFLMQLGFAFIEAGCCRAKNVQNILLKNLSDVCVGVLTFWVIGYALAYGGPYNESGIKTNRFIGTEHFLGLDFVEKHADGQIEPSYSALAWFFQSAFCAAASTIVSGGVAERMNYPAYLVFSIALCGFIYPMVVSWTWGYGFLADMNAVGYMDFAGSGIVHMTGGIGALVGAILAGPRLGRWEHPEEYVPHSLPFVVFGTFILWFGWYGFNCGSTLELHTAAKGFMAAQVAMNTTLAAATGALTVFGIRYILSRGKYDIGGLCNGILAGLVSITAGCGNVECGSAVLIAIIGGMLYQAASMLLLKLAVDDPIDAFAVHGVCGAWGTLAAAFFDEGAGMNSYHGWSGFACVHGEDGNCLKDANSQAILANLCEVIVILVWSGFWTAALFLPFKYMGWLRAIDDVQLKGFDQTKHHLPKAYVHDTQRDKVEIRQQEADEQRRAAEAEEREKAKKKKFVPIKR